MFDADPAPSGRIDLSSSLCVGANREFGGRIEHSRPVCASFVSGHTYLVASGPCVAHNGRFLSNRDSKVLRRIVGNLSTGRVARDRSTRIRATFENDLMEIGCEMKMALRRNPQNARKCCPVEYLAEIRRPISRRTKSH